MGQVITCYQFCVLFYDGAVMWVYKRSDESEDQHKVTFKQAFLFKE